MDWLTFVAEVLKAGSWPIAAITLAVLFRNELKALLGRVKKGKIGGTEFEFEETVRAAKELAAPTLPSAPAELPAETIALATTDPRTAILAAWLDIESAVNFLVNKWGKGATTFFKEPMHAIRFLPAGHTVSPEHIALISELRILRHQAAHDHDFNPAPESVLTYVQLAKNLVQILREAADDRPGR